MEEMHDKKVLVEELLDKAQEYTRTNIELLKLKAITKVSDTAASAVAGIILAITSIFFLILFSIGLALWIGDELGKSYYGFFIIAGIYLLIGILCFVFRKKIIQAYFNNYIIDQIFKNKQDAAN